MIIDGFNKLTLLDYPNQTACIIFTRGCNFKCGFCQNSGLICCDKKPGLIKEEEVLEYLDKRRNILDGIVISGGEPTIQKDLISFIKKIKDKGFLVKLDTNGSNPDILEYLLENKLVDYVAMDIKGSLEKYPKIILKKYDLDKVLRSIELLKNSNVMHEFRTTIMKEFHTIDDLIKIVNFIGKKEKYYLQNFEDSSEVLCKNLHGFTDLELMDLENTLKKYSKNIKVRGLNYDNYQVKEGMKVYVQG